MTSASAPFSSVELKPETVVREGLARLEAESRTLALLALADWEQTGLLLPELTPILAAMQRPTWTHCNSLLTALREVRRRILWMGAATERDKVRRAETLSAILEFLDEEIDYTHGHALGALVELTNLSLNAHPHIGTVLALPLLLAYQIDYAVPTEKGWWHRAANAIQPLLDMLDKGELHPTRRPTRGYPAPWFLPIQQTGELFAFQGMRDSFPFYGPTASETKEESGQSSAILTAFQHLLGTNDQWDTKKALAELDLKDPQGILLGDFLIGPLVGEGRFSNVHVGWQVTTGRKAAIKILHDEVAEDANVRFQQQAADLSKLSHPGLVKVYGWGEHNWTAPGGSLIEESLTRQNWFQEFAHTGSVKTYVAFEWLEGKTLEQIYQGPPEGRSDLKQIALWFIEAANALATVHAAGLIHRDIKPSNLMLTSEGRIKVLDFGIARSPEELGTAQTKTGKSLGTPVYLSPEQLSASNQEAEVGPASDIYSLCAVFYELCTGNRLYHHDRTSIGEIETRKLKGILPDSPQSLAPRVSWTLESILYGGLETSLPERYRSMIDLERDLRHYLKHEPTEQRRPPADQRVRLWAMRHPVTALVGAALMVAVVIGFFSLATALFFNRNALAKSEENAETERREKEGQRLAKETALTTAATEQGRREALEKQVATLEKSSSRLLRGVKFAHARAEQALSSPRKAFFSRRPLEDGLTTLTRDYHEEFLRDDEPGDRLVYLELVDALLQLAERAKKKSPQQTAEFMYQAATVLNRIGREHRENQELLIRTAKLHNERALVLLSAKELAHARNGFDSGLRTLKELPEEAGNQPKVQELRGRLLANMGGLRLEQGEEEDALKYLEEALATFEALDASLKTKPTSYDLDVVAVQRNLARFALNRIKLLEAFVLLTAAAARLQDAGVSLTDNRDRYHALGGNLYFELSEFYQWTGDRHKALEWAEKCVELWGALQSAHPESLAYRAQLGKAYGKSIALLAEAHKKDEAQQLGNKLNLLLTDIGPDRAEHLTLTLELAMAYHRLAQLDGILQNWKKSLEWVERASARYKEILAKHAKHPQAMPEEARCQRLLAEAMMETGRYREALKLWNVVVTAKDETPEMRKIFRCLCHAGMGDDYVEMMKEMDRATREERQTLMLLRQAAAYALAATAAEADNDSKQATDYWVKTVQRLKLARNKEQFKDAQNLKYVKESPHFTRFRERKEYADFLKEVEAMK